MTLTRSDITKKRCKSSRSIIKVGQVEKLRIFGSGNVVNVWYLGCSVAQLLIELRVCPQIDMPRILFYVNDEFSVRLISVQTRTATRGLFAKVVCMESRR